MFLILFISLSAVFILRFLIGGNEDSWICQDGKWIKHGNPSEPKPLVSCEK